VRKGLHQILREKKVLLPTKIKARQYTIKSLATVDL